MSSKNKLIAAVTVLLMAILLLWQSGLYEKFQRSATSELTVEVAPNSLDSL